MFAAPTALISLIDDDRQWFKSRVGLEVSETPRDWAFCDHAIRLGAESVSVVPDATLDPRFSTNPLVVGQPHIRFYAGAVLAGPDGHALGTLCILDSVPRSGLSEAEVRQLRMLAAIVIDEMELTRAQRDAQCRMNLLQMAEAMSGVGHWRLDVSTNAVTWSDEVFRIHGVDRATFNPGYDDAVAFYHPDDRPIVRRAVAAAIADAQNYDFELRLERADGQQRHVRCKGACETDAAGRTVALVGVFQDITEHVLQVNTLSRSERRYRLLADNMADVLTRISLDGSSTYISPAIESLIGWKPTEMQMRSAQDFVHPNDRGLIQAAFEELAGGLAQKTVEHRAIHRDGHAVWVETQFKSMRDEQGRPQEIVAVIRNISERKEAECALADADGRYRFMAEHANDMIARMKPGGEIVLVTPGCVRVLGYDPEDLIGRRTIDMMHPEDLPMVADYFARLEGLGPGGILDPYQFRARHKSGEWVWLEGQPTLIFDDETGQPYEVQDVVRDVSKRKTLEQDLDEARKKAEAATSVKTEFLANMSHEIRTPLNGILGYADVLADMSMTEVQAGYVDRIRRAGRGLSSLISDILDVSKIEAGGLVIDAEPFDLLALSHEVTALIASGIANRLPITVTVADPMSGWVVGDEQRIRQILLNLLGNATKFTAEGSVVMSISVHGPELEVRISDTGIGISKAALETLFESFQQADTSVSRRFGGSGLGLSISRSLARLMKGDVRLESCLGQGTTAVFTLPYVPTSVHVTAGHTSERTTEPPDHGLRILVVDDAEMNRDLMNAVLKDAGHFVSMASSGQEALALLQGGSTFDAIVMDVQMPGMDGRETVRRLRKMSGLVSGMRVIGWTANVMPEQIAACFEAGMDDHLPKPFRRSELADCLSRVRRSDAEAVPVAENAPAGALAEALADLSKRYREQLGELSGEVAALSDLPVADQVPAVTDLAHKLAGTAGMLGFRAVSEAAVGLDTAGRQAVIDGGIRQVAQEVSLLLDVVRSEREKAELEIKMPA